jgi:hypothetical protein
MSAPETAERRKAALTCLSGSTCACNAATSCTILLLYLLTVPEPSFAAEARFHVFEQFSSEQLKYNSYL